MDMMEILFIGSIMLVFFAYFGYAASIFLIRLFHKKVVRKTAFLPDVTLIIAAHNEESKIVEKLENTLALEYPRHKLEILVASDGSTDRTNAIVKEYENKGIKLLAIAERRGKENAQKEAVKRAKSDVLVFTDVATHLNPGGLKEMVLNFADPSVGCVSSEDNLLGKYGERGGESFYLRYEMWVRRLESTVNSLVGLSGSFFAARKEVCLDFSGEMDSDFRTVLNSVKLGLRGVSESKAIGYYLDLPSGSQQFDRKVRTVLRGLTVFFAHPEFLNIFRYGFFSYQYFCHKLLRWMVPFFLSIALVTNLMLATRSPVCYVLLLCQSAFYTVAVWGWQKTSASGNALFKLPAYFLAVNVSILVAWWRYLKNQRVLMWPPSER